MLKVVPRQFSLNLDHSYQETLVLLSRNIWKYSCPVSIVTRSLMFLTQKSVPTLACGYVECSRFLFRPILLLRPEANLLLIKIVGNCMLCATANYLHLRASHFAVIKLVWIYKRYFRIQKVFELHFCLSSLGDSQPHK